MIIFWKVKCRETVIARLLLFYNIIQNANWLPDMWYESDSDGFPNFETNVQKIVDNIDPGIINESMFFTSLMTLTNVNLLFDLY